MPSVRRGTVAVDRCDANDRRMSHRGSREVAQRVVVRAFPLHAPEAEGLRSEPAGEVVGAH